MISEGRPPLCNTSSEAGALDIQKVRIENESDDLRSTSDRPPTDLRPAPDRPPTDLRPAPDRPPTDLRPAFDRPPTDRPTSDRPPTDQPCLGYDRFILARPRYLGFYQSLRRSGSPILSPSGDRMCKFREAIGFAHGPDRKFETYRIRALILAEIGFNNSECR